MTHTQGPWHINERAAGGYEITALDSDDEGFFIESIATSHRAANARLVAAAPILLQALQRLTHPNADDTDLAYALEAIRSASQAE